MTQQIYTSDQILDAVIDGKKMKGPESEYRFFDDLFWDTIANSALEIGGTPAATTGIGGQIFNDSGAVAGNRANVNTDSTNRSIDLAKDLILKIRALTDEILQVNHFIGLFSALPTAASPPVEPSDGAYFRALHAGAAVNWFAVSRVGASETAVDTGILGDASMHNFEIRKTSGKIIYLIDGVIVATITTNISATTVSAGMVTVTREAVFKTQTLDTIDIWGKR